MTEEKESWPTAELKALCVTQAKTLRKQAAEGCGLQFEAYLPPRLAEWLLERIEQGVFLNPSEAAFVLIGECQELEPHTDLRKEFLSRRIGAGLDDPNPGMPIEDFSEYTRKKLEAPRPKTVVWKRPEKELDWSQCPAVESVPGKVSGAWVLKGTRMPISAILENFEDGASIDDIVRMFDGIDRSQVQTIVEFDAQRNGL